ncbi:MAG: dienelactone hydrolase family protein [Actinomycetales bacterium]|nr:dienelactone hydrolase family protein [Actinomycetales bacterium]
MTSAQHPNSGQRVTFTEDGVTGAGYLALPASGSGPAVIVVQEWWGLVGHITDVADRFAAAGFVALAPDLYHGQATTEPDEARKLLMELDLARAGEEICKAAAYLLSREDVTSPTVGTVGFCMGGSLAIWSGTLSPDITACVGFYPGASWERHAPHWANFAGKRAQIHCAEGDGTSAAPGIQEAKRGIEAAGGQCVVFDYPGTAHAFFNDDRPEVYSPEAAHAAWQRTTEFLREQLCG